MESFATIILITIGKPNSSRVQPWLTLKRKPRGSHVRSYWTHGLNVKKTTPFLRESKNSGHGNVGIPAVDRRTMGVTRSAACFEIPNPRPLTWYVTRALNWHCVHSVFESRNGALCVQKPLRKSPICERLSGFSLLKLLSMERSRAKYFHHGSLNIS